MNKTTLALDAVIAITATLALTTVATSVTQQALATGNSSSVGKGNPMQVPLSTHSPCPNQANSTAGNSSSGTAGNSSHIVKSDLLFSGNNIVLVSSPAGLHKETPSQVTLGGLPCPHAPWIHIPLFGSNY